MSRVLYVEYNQKNALGKKTTDPDPYINWQTISS
jgi:hypothetical protein